MAGGFLGLLPSLYPSSAISATVLGPPNTATVKLRAEQGQRAATEYLLQRT